MKEVIDTTPVSQTLLYTLLTSQLPIMVSE
jgi:hypothetical protein